MLDAGILFLILSVVNVSGVPVTSDPDLKNENVIQILPDIVPTNGGTHAHGGLNGVLFKTVIKYYCSPEIYRPNSTTILYGANGWTFPEQDVSLTLSYPTINKEIGRNIEDYRISGYQINMFTDGSESSGYIAAGGLMQNNITLKFTVSGITTLSYEFWLYGAPSTTAASWPTSLSNRMC